MVMGGPETTLAAVDLLEPPQVFDSMGDGEAIEEIAATTASQHVVQIGNIACAAGEIPKQQQQQQMKQQQQQGKQQQGKQQQQQQQVKQQ